MTTTTMARDVIKWIQSLELGIPILHPKRDFANGYIIATIFARYYPGELQPWALYTGNSEKLKKSNWVRDGCPFPFLICLGSAGEM